MSQNHRLPLPDCAAFAPLLPLASHDLLSEEQATALHAHLATCTSCRAELTTYDQAEAALRHAFRLHTGSVPPLSREEIMRALISRPDRAMASSPSSGLSAPLESLTEPPLRKRRFFASVPALAATLAIVLMAVAIFGIPGLLPGLRGSGGTTIDLTKTLAPTGVDLTHVVLHSISMVSPDEGWAVGVTRLHTPPASAPWPEYGDPVILHYSQGHWKPVPFPPDVKSRIGCRTSGIACPAISLRDISMVSATDGWAVGNSVLPPNADGITFGVVLHYTGGKWVFDRLLGSQLSSVFMRTASDGWMVGQGGNGGASVFHFDGGSWTAVNGSAFTSLLPQTIVALSATDVWLGGTDFSGSGFDGDAPEVILRYDGSRWLQQSSDLANARIYGMALVSPGEGWAVGSLSGGTGPHPAHAAQALVERYSHGKWQRETSFADPLAGPGSSLYGIAMVSASEGWAVGSDGLIVHDLGGTWTRVSSPTSQTLEGIAMVSPTEGWAVGDQGTVLHYSDGTWGLYHG